MPRNTVKDKAFPVGLFILIGFVILVGGVFWLRNFTIRPAYSFTAVFDNPGRIIAGYPVYYRGINVGRVVSAKLSEDQKNSLIEIGVSQKDLALSKHIKVLIKEEGFTGQRYIALEPMDKIAGNNDIIADGDQILGTSSGGWDKVQDLIAMLTRDNRLEKMLDETGSTMKDLKTASQSLDRFARSAQGFVDDNGASVEDTMASVRIAAIQLTRFADSANGFLSNTGSQINSTLPRLTGSIEKLRYNTDGIPGAIQSVQGTTGKLEETLNSIQGTTQQIGQTFQTINSQLVDTSLIPNLNTAIVGVNGLLDSPSTVSPSESNSPGSIAPSQPNSPGTVPLVTPSSISPSGVQVVPSSALPAIRSGTTITRRPTVVNTLGQAGQAIRRVNCVSAQANQILSQRFLGFKLFFGKPGKGYECNDVVEKPILK